MLRLFFIALHILQRTLSIYFTPRLLSAALRCDVECRYGGWGMDPFDYMNHLGGGGGGIGGMHWDSDAEDRMLDSDEEIGW